MLCTCRGRGGAPFTRAWWRRGSGAIAPEFAAAAPMKKMCSMLGDSLRGARHLHALRRCSPSAPPPVASPARAPLGDPAGGGGYVEGGPLSHWVCTGFRFPRQLFVLSFISLGSAFGWSDSAKERAGGPSCLVGGWAGWANQCLASAQVAHPPTNHLRPPARSVGWLISSLVH